MDSPKNSDDSCGSPQNSNLFEEISSGLDHNATSPVTPESDKGSPDASPIHDSDSSYSELDSEAEAFYSSLNYHLVSPGTMDTHELAEKQLTYGDLMKRFLQCEEELKTTSVKLHESEQEIEKLKGETEQRDFGVLRTELETARKEIEARDIDIETEKSRVLELQTQMVDLQTKLSDSCCKIENLVNELEVSRECLYVPDAVISTLREQLCDCKQSFSTEKTKLQADILEKQTFFETRVREMESRIEVLEDQIRHSDATELELQRKEVELQAEINALKTDLDSRGEHIEALNKEFDKHKLRYDMLIAEKDGVCAELDNVRAEMRSRDIQIKQMEEQLVSESGNAKNTGEELRAMVKELERQVELQRNVIAEGKEEKLEAIRQLCFSLDHYKSGYRLLLQLLSSNNKQQQAIMVV